MRNQLLSSLPKTWETLKFHDVGEFLRGPFGSSVKKSVCVTKGPNTFKLYEQGNVIRNDFERGNYYVTAEKFKELEKFELSSGDIVITCAGTLGRIAIVPEKIEKGIFNSVLMRIRLNKSRILPQYFLFYFQSPQVQDKIFLKSSGATIKNLFTTETLRNFEVPLPPISIQKQIVDILQRAKNLKEKREQANLLANKILQAVFLQMFGSQIADGKIGKLGLLDVFNVTTGKLNSNAAVENGDFPFFTCSRQTFRINQYSFDCEALILSGNNAAGEYSVKHYKGKFDAYQRTYILTLKNKKRSYEYFQFLLENKLQELKNLSIGTNTKYLTLGIMKKLQLPIPEVEQQEEFSKISRELGKIENIQHTCTQEISNLFDSLISKAFKGGLLTEVVSDKQSTEQKNHSLVDFMNK